MNTWVEALNQAGYLMNPPMEFQFWHEIYIFNTLICLFFLSGSLVWLIYRHELLHIKETPRRILLGALAVLPMLVLTYLWPVLLTWISVLMIVVGDQSVLSAIMSIGFLAFSVWAFIYGMFEPIFRALSS